MVVEEKSPEIWKLVIWKPVEPALVKVAICGALEVPMACPPKYRLIGEMFAAEPFTTSYTPKSIVPTMRVLPSKSVDGRLGAALLPALTAGEAACRWKSLLAALMKRGSEERFPGFVVESQMPAQAAPEALNASL